MLQNLDGHLFRFGSGDIEAVALLFQLLEEVGDAGVGSVLKLSDGNVTAAVDMDGFFSFVLRNAETDETVMQGRADKDAHSLPVGDGNAKMLQSQSCAVDNALTGVGKSAVQVEQDGLGSHNVATFLVFSA